MMTYLERYRRGEREQVWDELIALGAAVRAQPLLADAQAVAAETMSRAKANIELLIPRLREVGYRFGTLGYPNSGSWYGDAYPTYESPLPGTGITLDQIESQLGPMPLSLRAWYEVVGAVNFLGFHPDWPEPQVLDPLCIGPIRDTTSDLADQHEYWKSQVPEDERAGEPFGMDVGPDDYHKADISGGPPYKVEFPAPLADARLLYEWHETTFVDYLRTCFRWAGFPGFERWPEAERPSDHLALLTKGLLPL